MSIEKQALNSDSSYQQKDLDYIASLLNILVQERTKNTKLTEENNNLKWENARLQQLNIFSE